MAALSLASAALAETAVVTVPNLADLSLEQLSDLEVTSVSKSAEPLNQAPASIFVITAEDIRRSGATTIPEMLRLAPNLQVHRVSSSKYVIGARGLSGLQSAQNFSNKLLVVVDGRSAYNPLFSGVYWDLQDVIPADIERIEVISGPAGTLWGANAVNGVINITTKAAADTQGGLVEAELGSLESAIGVRFGGKAGDKLAWRIYGRLFAGDDTETTTGAKATDKWSRPQAGFRLDYAASPRDQVTVQGDAIGGVEKQGGAQREIIQGRNLTARWVRSGENGQSLQVQAFYDRQARASRGGNGDFHDDTFDLDLQHSFNWGPRQQVVWGGGVRLTHYVINGTASLQFAPPERTLQLVNAFVQDTVAVTPNLRLILGLKLEDEPYTGVSAMPNVRVTWNAGSKLMLWAAASRAVRSATPFDRDVVEKAGAQVLLTGGPDFQPEKVTAYEAGLRVQPTGNTTLSATAFYNVYDDLRSAEFSPGHKPPVQWGNGMRGWVHGLEAWGDYAPTPWWRLSAGLTVLREHFKFTPGSAGLIGIMQAGDDPKEQAFVRSAMNFGKRVNFDVEVRYMAELPKPRVPSYVELGGRLGFAVTDRIELAIVGANLLHARHLEFPASEATAIPRNVTGELRVRF